MTVEITVLENRALKICASLADIEEACSTRNPDALTDIEILTCLLEPCWTNGEYYVFTADQFGHLTEAPMISKEADCPDDGLWIMRGDVWWFPNYQVENCMDTLRDCGEVVFPFAYNADDPNWNNRQIDWSKVK